VARTTAREPGPALPGPGEPPLPPFPGEEVSVGGHWLFVRRAGSASSPPVLLVHGLGGASTNWTDLMALLAPRADARALDLPGFGWSAPPSDGRYALSTHVRAVVRYLEQWGAGPVHLVGNSLGGAVATRVASERPDLVRTLALISPALPDVSPVGRDLRLPALLVPGLGQLLLGRAARSSPARRAAATLDLVYADPARIPEERRREAEAEVLRRDGLDYAGRAFTGSLRGLAAAFLERGPSELWRQAAGVQAPVQIIWGARDRLVRGVVARKAARRFRDARLVIFDGVGHVAQLEAPERTAAVLTAFWDETS
jgi:pimeloyl-ACP methyl ester carboxylesterase